MELSPASNPDADSTVRPSRRKSGRVVKAPQFLASHEQDRTGDGDVDMNSESDEDEDQDDEADEEELKEQRRRKRKAPAANKAAPSKKSKPNGATTTLAIRSAPARPKKAKAPGHGGCGNVQPFGESEHAIRSFRCDLGHGERKKQRNDRLRKGRLLRRR